MHKQLLEWVKKARKKFSPKEIREQAVQAGWEEQEIEEAIKIAERKKLRLLSIFVICIIILGGIVFLPRIFTQPSETPITSFVASIDTLHLISPEHCLTPIDMTINQCLQAAAIIQQKKDFCENHTSPGLCHRILAERTLNAEYCGEDPSCIVLVADAQAFESKNNSKCVRGIGNPTALRDGEAR